MKQVDADGNETEVATITNGKDGKDGKDGTSVTATKGADGSVTVKQVDADGNETEVATITNGKDGKDGQDGKSATAEVKDNGDGTHTVTVTNPDGSKTETTVKNGQDGKSATAEVKDNGDGTHTVTVTNPDGSKTETIVKDGKNGKDGGSGDFNLTTSESAGEVEGTSVETVQGGDTVTLDAGKNIKLTQDGNKITVATKDEVVLGAKDGTDGKDGVDGKLAVNGKDGSAVAINGKDGSIGLNGKDGKDGLSLKSADGAQGVDGKDGANGLPGESGKTRLVYQPTNPDGTPNGDPEQLATMKDGLLFTGNNEDTLNRHKLNTLVKVQGEGVDKAASDSFTSAAGNINVKADGNDKLEIQLAKDLKNIDSVQFGDENGPKITNKDGNINVGDKDGNTTSISNVKDNLADASTAIKQPDANSKDALADKLNNAATVGDVLNAGWNLQGNGKAVDTVIHNDIVDFVDGKGTKVTVENKDGKNTIKVDSAVEFVNTDANDTSTPSDTAKMSGNNPVQLTNVGSGVRQEAPVANQAAPTTAEQKAIAEAVKNASGDTLTNAVNVGDLQAVAKAARTEVEAGKNMTVTERTGANGQAVYTVATKDDLVVTSVTAGNTTLNSNGITIAAPTAENPNNTVSLSPIGLNNGGNTITNVAPGVNGTDAVNVNQLTALGNNLQQNIDSVGKKAYAGVAGAIAQGSIPQVTRPGTTGLGIGGGYYGGESAMAIGMSSMSDGGNWIIKGNVSTNTGGHVGVGFGGLYQW